VMTATLNDVVKKKPAVESAEQRAAAELVRRAREQGLSLTGPDGLLKQLTKTVLETALDEEMTEHLGYEKHDPAGAGTGNIRNGTRAKTVLTGRAPSSRRSSRSGSVGCPGSIRWWCRCMRRG
jgi:putative transposase